MLKGEKHQYFYLYPIISKHFGGDWRGASQTSLFLHLALALSFYSPPLPPVKCPSNLGGFPHFFPQIVLLTREARIKVLLTLNPRSYAFSDLRGLLIGLCQHKESQEPLTGTAFANEIRFRDQQISLLCSGRPGNCGDTDGRALWSPPFAAFIRERWHHDCPSPVPQQDVCSVPGQSPGRVAHEAENRDCSSGKVWLRGVSMGCLPSLQFPDSLCFWGTVQTGSE